MQLALLLSRLKTRRVRIPNDLDIRAICYDSRQVTEGSLFVALRGERVDGHKYISQAIAKGAVAIVLEDGFDDLSAQIAGIEVANTRLVLGPLAAFFSFIDRRKN